MSESKSLLQIKKAIVEDDDGDGFFRVYAASDEFGSEWEIYYNEEDPTELWTEVFCRRPDRNNQITPSRHTIEQHIMVLDQNAEFYFVNSERLIT